MDYTDEDLAIEAERRRRLSLQGAPTGITPPEQGPSAEEFLAGLPRADTPQVGLQDKVRAGLSGLTLGAAAPIGSAIAALPASFGSGNSLGDTYKDIRSAVQAEEDAAYALDPGGQDILEGAGAVTGLVGAALPSATRAALKRGASRVGGKAGNAAQGTRGALNKPRVRVVAGAAAAAPEVAKRTAFQRAKDAAIRTSAGSAVGEILADEGTAGGILGLLGPAIISNPLGRWGLSRAAKSAVGDKARAFTYMASHPATRREAKRLAKAMKERYRSRR